MALEPHGFVKPFAPNSAPPFTNMHWTNTGNGDQYISNGTASVANWVLLGAGGTIAHSATTGQTADDHHNELHTIDSHSDTSATGAELDTLTDGSNADGLHSHSGGGGGADIAAFDANQATYPASAPAAATSRNEHPVISFDDTTNENIIFHGLISNDYSAGNVTVLLDWVAATATTGDVKWDVQFERLADAGTDIDADSFAAVQTSTDTTDATSGKITRSSIVFTQAQADSIAAGDSFRLKVTRDANAAGDTLSGDAQFLRVGIKQ